MIGDKIQDINDPVWRLLIQLRSVVEHVCRPTYTVAQVVDMNEVIEEYLYSRSEIFPLETLKPKHHFLAHYPQLTMQCGPLIRLWTLRFKSKHAYFKKAIRSSQNFINVTQSLSEKHQLLQALYAAGSLFRQPLSYGHDGQKQDNAGPFNLKIYSPEFQKAVNESQYDINNENTIVCTKVYFNGVIYKNGSVVLIDRESSDSVSCGEINLVLVHNNETVILVVEEKVAFYLPDCGLYKIENSINSKFSCVCLQQLLDIFPLEIYRVFGADFLALRHTV